MKIDPNGKEIKDLECLLKDDLPEEVIKNIQGKIREIKQEIENFKFKKKLEALPKEVEIKYVITSCRDCHFMETERTSGAGYALDWFCKKLDNKKIAGYIEWDRDEPKRIPQWCPFRIKKENK